MINSKLIIGSFIALTLAALLTATSYVYLPIVTIPEDTPTLTATITRTPNNNRDINPNTNIDKDTDIDKYTNID